MYNRPQSEVYPLGDPLPLETTGKHQKRKIVRATAACIVLIITTTLLLSFYVVSTSSPSLLGSLPNRVQTMLSRGKVTSPYSLADTALEEILERGAPILGSDLNCSKNAATCNWMAKIPDNTKLVHMNLPGTHDSATWNYSDATQAALLRYTGTDIPPAKVYRCQQQSLFQMLNDGIRVFDLRYAYNPGNDTIGFYHSRALLAPTTSVIDVLYGYYSWLEKHSSETVLLSFNHEGGTGTVEDERLQQMILDIFSRPTNKDTRVDFLKRRFWAQGRGELGTLGEHRGKIILLQRFSYSQLNPTPDPKLLNGLDLGADRWTDNGDDIHLLYNEKTNATAFIEDRYAITLPSSPITPTVDAYITSKFGYTTAHLENAILPGETADQLYITFASAAFLQDPRGVSMYPITYALGEGNTPGMNKRLLPWFKARRGRRFGIIMLDFYDAEPGLVGAILGL